MSEDGKLPIKREKLLDAIDEFEKRLRNIGVLGKNVVMECDFHEIDYTYDPQMRHCAVGGKVKVNIVDFLHTIYHSVKADKLDDFIEG